MGEANILRVAPTATRFAYLPISMPSPATEPAHNFPSAAAQISKQPQHGLPLISECIQLCHLFSFAHYFLPSKLQTLPQNQKELPAAWRFWEPEIEGNETEGLVSCYFS